MTASINCVTLSFILFVSAVTALVELPNVAENDIVWTEAVIRNTLNTLFTNLRLKDIHNKTKLKEYSTVHKRLILFTLQDYNTLKQIAKLTRVDKSKTNNETQNFMAAINELLNENNDHNYITEDSNDESVIKYIQLFLEKLNSLKAEYGVNNEQMRVNEEVYRILKDSKGIASVNTTEDANIANINEDNSVLLEDYWKPEQSGRRIYQGKKVKIKHFPFMVNIQMFNQFHCGGAIIKSDLVISAASCLQLAHNNRFFRENPAFLSVRVGSKFYNGGESIPILEVYFHPGYNPQNLRNNICLLRLIRKLNFRRKKVKRINLDKSPNPLPVNTDGITIFGWGARGSNNIVKNPWENTLSYAVLDVYPLRECQDVYSKEYVTRKNFCAGFFSKGGGACNRDVGGPGVVGGTLMGVISFGSPVCGSPDAPTVFTKVGYYTDWIEDIMEQDVPYIKKRTTLTTKSYAALGRYYTNNKSTTFSLPPLSDSQPTSVDEGDDSQALRNTKLFKEYLATMFDSKENDVYRELLRDYNPSDKVENQGDTKEKEKPKLVRRSTTPLYIARTVIENVEPAASEGMVAEVTEMSPLSHHSIATGLTGNNVDVLKEDKHGKLERNLVNLIDNVDLKHIIGNISSLKDKREQESKLKKMLTDDQVTDALTKDDDSVLTLLYISDMKNNSGKIKKLDVFDYKDAIGDNHDDYDDNDDTGLSIAVDQFKDQLKDNQFKDLTYRNQNVSVLHDILPKVELYDLLAEATSN